MTSVVDEPGTARAGHRPPRPPRPPRHGAEPAQPRRVRALVLAGLTAGSTYLVVDRGVLPVAMAALLMLTLVTLVPTSPWLSRRLALNGSLLVGWAHVLWWVHLPVEVNRGAAVVAGAAGVAAVAAVRGGVRTLVPRVRPVDALPGVAAVLGTVVMSSWAFAGSPRRALEVMLPGADNYAHFHMFATIRTYGAVTTSLPSPADGPGWGFDEYPQSFHALAATLSQVLYPDLGTGSGLFLAYSQSVALVVVLGIAVLTAAVVSLPGLADRPLLALPLVTLTWTAYLWKPGMDALADGFGNFWLACVAAATALLLSLAASRPPTVAEAAALGGLLVAVSHAWAPIAVLAAPAALAVLLPVRSLLALDRRRGVALLIVAAATGLGVLKAAVALLSAIEVKDLVLIDYGGVHGSNPLPVLLLFSVGVVVCLRAPAWMRREASGTDEAGKAVAKRVRLLVLTPVVGLLMGAALLVAQLMTVGTSAYYFIKLYLGYELVLAALVPAVCGVVLATRPALRASRVVVASAAVVATVAATQFFGTPASSPPAMLTDGLDGTASVGAPYDAREIADGVVRAVDAVGTADASRVDYLGLGRQRAAQVFYPNGWFHGATASLTGAARARIDQLRVPAESLDEAAPVVDRLLRRNPGVSVLVAPEHVDALRQRLGTPDLAARVTTWRGAPRR